MKIKSSQVIEWIEKACEEILWFIIFFDDFYGNFLRFWSFKEVSKFWNWIISRNKDKAWHDFGKDVQRTTSWGSVLDDVVLGKESYNTIQQSINFSNELKTGEIGYRMIYKITNVTLHLKTPERRQLWGKIFILYHQATTTKIASGGKNENIQKTPEKIEWNHKRFKKVKTWIIKS